MNNFCMQNSASVSNRDVFIRDWRLVYSPNNPVLGNLVGAASNPLGINQPVGVDTVDQMNGAMLYYGVIAGIQFHHPAVRSFHSNAGLLL